MYRRVTWFVVCVLLLIPLSGLANIATAQDSPGSNSGFSQDIIVEDLAAGEVVEPVASPSSLNFERVMLPAGASLVPRQVPTAEVIYVERGALTIVDSLGLASTLTEGNSAHLRAGATYEARNDGTGDASILRLSLAAPASATPAATPMATPVVDSQPDDVAITLLAGFDLTDVPTSPTMLFLARATWEPGVDSRPYIQNGPIGLLVEAGTLTISSPSGIDGQLGEGNSVLLPADQPLSTRNDGDAVVVALMFGIVPASGDAVAAVPPTPTPSPTATPTPSPTPETTAAPAPTPESTPTPSPTPEPMPVAGTVLYEADTSGGLGEWSGAGGWQTVSGMLVNDGTSDSAAFIAAPFEVPTADYAVEVEMQWARDGETFGVVTRGGDGAGYWVGFVPSCNWSPNEDSIVLWTAPIEGFCAEGGRIAGTEVELDSDWHTYRVEVQGNIIRVFMDGGQVIETTDNRFLSPGQVGLWSDGAQVSVRRFTVIALGGES